MHTTKNVTASDRTPAAHATRTRRAGKLARDARPAEIAAARRRIRRAGKAAARAALRG